MKCISFILNKLTAKLKNHIILRIFLGLAFSFIFTGFAFARQNELKYDLDLEFNSSENILSGHAKILFTNHSPVALDTVYLFIRANAFRSRDLRSFQKYETQFEAPASINIESITIDAKPVSVMQPESVNPAVILPESLQPGDSVELIIQFTTIIPPGKSKLCSTYSEKSYCLIYFYPRIAEYRRGRWQITGLNELERAPLEFANYSVRFTLPDYFQPAGSLQIDSVVSHNDKNTFIFHSEYLQDIGFILNDRLKVSTIRSRPHNEVKFISRFSANDKSKDKIATEIINDIVDYYAKYLPGMNQQITIYPTVIPGGFTTSRLILIDKTILTEATKLDYLSLYILAREIAHQYLGFNVESENDPSVSISDGLAGFLANDYLKNRYEFLQQKYKLSDNQLISFNTKVFNVFTSGLEKENILQPARASNERANTIFINTQTRFLKSQKLVEMSHYVLGDSLFSQVLAQYQAFIQSDSIDPQVFFKIAEEKSGYEFIALYQNFLHLEQPTDLKIQKVIRSQANNSEHITDVIIKQSSLNYLPLEVNAFDRSGNVYNHRIQPRTGTFDTLTLVTDKPITKIVLDPNRQIWDSNRLNNQYPRSVVFKFLVGLPSIDSYQIFYYPTFDFNNRDIMRFGVKLRGRYWINMRPLFPAQSLDEWSFGLNYGYKSKTFGYDLSYSTSLLAFLFKPRIYLRWRDYFDLMEGKISTEVYLGDVKYWGFNRVQGYQKLNLGLDYQKVRSLEFLNTNKWETGQSLKPYLDYVNFHNWGNIRHIVHAKFVYGLPVGENHFSFDKLTLDGQVKMRLNHRIWLYQRLFYGNAHGNVPKQEYFYFFGKNVLENQSFESYRLAQGEGDMRGYGDQSLKSYKMLTSNTELRRNLALAGAAMFDCLIFLDSGILPESFSAIDWKQTHFDAGLGVELELLDILKVGMHFPLWVSHPPQSEPRFDLRWVITTDLQL